MIAVDSSVWIEALRGGPAARELRLLLDRDEVALAAPVRVEILSGASRAELPRLRRVLAALPLFYPAEGTWARIDAWIDTAVSAGQRFGFGDLLVAAIAAENGQPVWSLDRDFARMARLRFVTLHAPQKSPPPHE